MSSLLSLLEGSSFVSTVFTTPTLVYLLIAVIVIYVWSIQHEQCNYPSGPFNLPILGNLPQVVLSGSMVNFLSACRKKFGDIFTVEYGGSKRVVISGYDNFYQLLVKNADVTSNRSSASLPPAGMDAAKVRPGLLWAPFPHWKTLRSFSLNVLRDEGMGKLSLEPKIHIEIEKFCEWFIEPILGKPTDISQELPKMTCNVISELVLGERSDYDDPDFNIMLNAINKSIRSNLRAAITKNIPLAKYFKISGLTNNTSGIATMLPVMQKKIDKHRANLDPDNPQDVIDEFLIYQKKLQEEGEDNHCFTDTNLQSMAVQLYGAGTETTSTALKWAFLFTCIDTEIMENVYEEIKNKIGFDRAVSVTDRSQMPYTDSVLLETLRLANIVPMVLPHLLEKDTLINGKMIPAGADLMFNMSSVLNDSKVFENPEKFDPKRYLTDDVSLKRKRTIPFSMGRRVCLGESLARMEFFLMFVTLVQKYDIKMADRANVSTKPGNTSIITSPQPYKLIFTKRINQ